ncbi:COX15/CtaA family protein [Curvivirga aplysinae]|uniref:COX15/CtaA family protein n=1 Tax=Curvivirga aplysinae TaxID=2529852 RepID=UPI0012BCCDCC|nr:COX15/CtaA family protein [Curvivirga aplysinae]MTI08734.1 heme A synthase [Curvivirga aplysinae]
MTQQTKTERNIGLWLALSAFMVFMMMIIGAITRLTESGLSMVEWRPFIGWIPPIGVEEWTRVFELYKQTSEYQLANFGMSLEEFQNIFWWEYIHRVWGRMIGIVYGLPFFWFLLRGQIPKGYKRHFTALLLLGGFQGVIGWWMVKSGFVDRTDVSQYRLATHLGVAFLILGYLIWVMLDFLAPIEQGRKAVQRSFRRVGAMAHAVIFFTAISGALVAGLGAGRVFNDWPFMDGEFFPNGYFWRDPWWINFFETVQSVQFNHRSMAYLTAIVIIWLWIASKRHDLAPRAKNAINALFGMLILQIALGISTLMLAVPMHLAVTHQAGAAITFALSIWVMKELRGQSASYFDK